jgi:hypothetical protein
MDNVLENCLDIPLYMYDTVLRTVLQDYTYR